MNKINPKRWSLKGLFSALIAFCALVSFSGVVFAQETGQIIGTVKDPNGAVVAGASVTVKNDVTGAERTATTSDEGGFIVTNLQSGSYTVTIKQAGFADFTQKVVLTVGSKFNLDATLGASGVTGSVDVVGGGIAEVNTQEQQLSTVVNQKQITELPTLTRNPYSLVGISGNVSSAASDSGRGAGFAINGQRAASTSILLDGGENVDTFTAAIGQSTPLDSVGEFRVITSNFSAEYGRASGGVVNAVTKAGTNEYHGSIYEFNRVSKLASNGFDNNAKALPRGVFTRNQFGYSVGGPIKKEKLFFFNSTEWTRVRSTGDILTYVPTPQLIAASSPNTQAFFAAYGQLVATPTGTVKTVAEVMADRGIFAGCGAFCALPANLPALQLVRQPLAQDLGGGVPQNTYQTVTRIDWNFSDKTQIYGRYAIEDQLFFDGTNAFSPYSGYNTGVSVFSQNALISVTHQFTNNLISQTRLTYNRLGNDQPLGSKGSTPTLYLRSGQGSSAFGENIAFPGILPFSPGLGLPFGGPQNIGQLSEDMSWTKGNHTMRFGGQFVYLQDNRLFGAYQTASEGLGGSYTQGFNNFVLGQLQQFQAAVNPQGRFPGQTITRPVSPPDFTRSNRYNEWALYFNDSWRVNSRFTVNLGVRYEYYGVQHNKNEQLDSNFYFGSGATIFNQIRNGSVQIATNSPAGALWNTDPNNWAPRVGFAWDLFGDGRTSIRGGYGIAYERNFGNVTFNVIQNPPGYAVISIGPADVGGTLPITVSNSGPLAGTGTTILPPTSLRHVREDITNAYAHFWSGAFQREIAKNTVVNVEYSGSAGRSLYSIENINRVGSGTRYLGGPVTCPFPTAANPAATRTVDRLNCIYTNINTRGNGGYSDYHALITSLESSNLFRTGLTLTARYTFAQAKDNLSSSFSESLNNFNLGLLDPFDPSLDYGYADFDLRHRFVASYIWEVPFFKNSSNWAVKNVLGGWSLTGIATLRGGSPFTVFECTDGITVCLRLIPNGTVRYGAPEQLIGTGNPNEFTYTDLSGVPLSGFTDASGGYEVGPYPANMTRRNSFRGPGFWNVDMGFYKNINITERYKLQFRGELYNIFNHANLFVDGFNAELNVGYVPANKLGRRNVQLAVKFLF